MYIYIGEDLRVVAEEKHQCQIKELESTFTKEQEVLAQMTENLRIAGEENEEKNSKIIDALKLSLSLAEEKYHCQIKELESSFSKEGIYINIHINICIYSYIYIYVHIIYKYIFIHTCIYL
jgi:hypothetical protein